jgi:hypothetical protein
MKKFFIVSYLMIFIFWDSQRLGLILRHCDVTPSPRDHEPTSCATPEMLIARIRTLVLSLIEVAT